MSLPSAFLSGLGSLFAFLLLSCAAPKPPEPAPENPTRKEEAPPAPVFEKPFVEPTALERQLDSVPLPLPAIKPAETGNAPAPVPGGAKSAGRKEGALPGATTPAKARFRLQVGAESDIDAATARKAELEKILGGKVDLVFDPPFYKLRYGYFETKQAAEDRLLELTDLNIQGFSVKN